MISWFHWRFVLLIGVWWQAPCGLIQSHKKVFYRGRMIVDIWQKCFQLFPKVTSVFSNLLMITKAWDRILSPFLHSELVVHSHWDICFKLFTNLPKPQLIKLPSRIPWAAVHRVTDTQKFYQRHGYIDSFLRKYHYVKVIQTEIRIQEEKNMTNVCQKLLANLLDAIKSDNMLQRKKIDKQWTTPRKQEAAKL